MRKTSIYKYYVFGYNYNVLTRGRKGETTKNLIKSIKGLFDFFEEMGLLVTKNAAQKLRTLLEKIEKLPQESIVSEELAAELRQAIEEIDTTLDSELKLKEAYILTEKRFELRKLLYAINELLAEKIFAQLPPIVKYDLQEAGKSIAFNLPTAAAFHALRATEGTLRFYYCGIVKKKRIPSLMWGNMITHLRSTRKKPSKAILDSLDNIRFTYRNPTQHPEERYDMDEAQDLFSVCIEAINKMMKDLQRKSAK